MTASIAPTRGAMSSQNKIPRGYELGQIQQYDPQQMELYQRQFGQLSPDSYLSRLAGGDEGLFNEMEAPAMRQFAQQQGSIASRFSGMGMGGRKSSGFQNAMSQESSDFAQNLQSQRQQLQRQAIQDMMGYSDQLLGQRPQEQFLTDKKPKWWQSLIAGLAPAAGMATGGYFGGPEGAKMGGKAGYAFGQAFQ